MNNCTRFTAICAVALSVFAAGCRDDDTTIVDPPVTTTTKFYTPTAQGNVRVYKHTELDTNSAVIEGSTTIDSVVTGSATMYVGKTAYMESYYRDGMKDSVASSYISGDSTTYYRYFTPIDFNNSPIAVPKRWVKEADFKSTTTSWVTFDSTLINFPVDVAGSTYTADSLHVKQTRTKGAISSVAFGTPAAPKQAQEVVVTTTFSGKVTSQFGAIPIGFSNIEKLYFVENVGLVKRHRDPYKVDVTVLKYPVNGFDYTLQSYVNK
ncbi:MAG: hypothetical protein V4642_14535 [Bacteroidota bacterium]